MDHKIFSKTLANRLKLVLPNIISKNERQALARILVNPDEKKQWQN